MSASSGQAPGVTKRDATASELKKVVVVSPFDEYLPGFASMKHGANRASSFVTRPATASDLPSILEIHNDAVLTTTAIWDYSTESLAERTAWFRAKEEAGTPVIVAVPSNSPSTVLGYGTYGAFRAWHGYKYTVEHLVYVRPESRGEGVGRSIVQAVLSCAEAANVKVVVGGVVAGNQASIALHRSLGFEEVGRFRQVGYKFGEWLDLHFFQRLLTGPSNPVEAP